MEYTASDKIDEWDVDQWLEVSAADEKPSKAVGNKHRDKKRRKPLRKNRKPSRPTNYIGQRTNNRLLKICAKNRAEGQARPQAE